MDMVWSITKIGFDVSYDGIIDPSKAVSEVWVYKSFDKAKEAFRSLIKIIGDTDAIRDSFLSAIDEGLYDEYGEDEHLKEKEEIIRTVTDTFLSGDVPEPVSEKSLAEFQVTSEALNDLSVNLLEGDGVLEIEDLWGFGNQHPELKTNALFMDSPTEHYYLRLENWFGEKHKFFLVEMNPVEVE